MFSRFLREAAELAREPRLLDSADEFQQIGDEWEKLGDWFRQTSEANDPVAHLDKCVAPLKGLANLEEAAWRQLQEIASV
jgi:hypothetical protein